VWLQYTSHGQCLMQQVVTSLPASSWLTTAQRRRPLGRSARPNAAPSVCRADADTCASGVDPVKDNIHDSCAPPEAAFVN
jgi:hypothetical protein